MRLHSIRHVPFEGIGRIENWSKEKGHVLSKTVLYAGDNFPELDDFDCLVIMGGPMGVYDKSEFPWLNDEIEFIKKAINADKKIIGICLGAQLIAESLGASVYKGPKMEIGWHEIELTAAGRSSSLFNDFPNNFQTIQWHGDTFDLPEGAELLMKGQNYNHQAFSYGTNVIALQFHLEFCEKCIKRLAKECEIKEGVWVQSEEKILAKRAFFDENESRLRSFLDSFTEI